MGRDWLVAAIEGDVSVKLDVIAEAYRWRRLGDVTPTSSWEEAESFIYENQSPTPHRPLGLCIVRGRTVVLEKHGEFCRAIFNELETAQQLAKHLGTRIFATLATDATWLNAYRLFDSTSRRLVWVGEEGIQDEGPKIPGEPEVEAESYDEESLIAVMELLGFDIDEGVERAGHYLLTRLAPPWVVAGVPQFSE